MKKPALYKKVAVRIVNWGAYPPLDKSKGKVYSFKGGDGDAN